MSFMDWVNMSIVVDIASVVFFGAVAWKLNKIQRKVAKLESDLLVTMRNPQAAKRLLKERQ